MDKLAYAIIVHPTLLSFNPKPRVSFGRSKVSNERCATRVDPRTVKLLGQNSRSGSGPLRRSDTGYDLNLVDGFKSIMRTDSLWLYTAGFDTRIKAASVLDDKFPEPIGSMLRNL